MRTAQRSCVPLTRSRSHLASTASAPSSPTRAWGASSSPGSSTATPGLASTLWLPRWPHGSSPGSPTLATCRSSRGCRRLRGAWGTAGTTRPSCSPVRSQRGFGCAAVGCWSEGPGPPQTGRGRADRLRGPEVLGLRAAEGLAVLLVDDVVTSGASMTAGATALRRVGAREIHGIAAAHTPRTLGPPGTARSGPWTSP